MTVFNKAALKAALAAMSDSILAIAKRTTVDNSAKLEGNYFYAVKSKIATDILGDGKLAVSSVEMDLSLPATGLTILLTGSPAHVKAKLGERGCYSIRGSCVSMFDDTAPEFVPLNPHPPRRGYADGEKRGLLEIDVVHTVVYRTFTVMYLEIEDGRHHELIYKQHSKNNSEWTPWVLVSGAGGVSFVEYTLAGPGGGVFSPTPVAKRFIRVQLSSTYELSLEDDASIITADGVLHPDNAEYVFIGVSGGGELSFAPYLGGGSPLSIITAAGKLPKMLVTAGKVATLRKIAPDTWLLTGDLMSP